MCKDGKCGHFDSLVDEQQQFARLDPVMLTGDKLKIAVDAQHKIDRYNQRRHEEHESFVERLHKAVKSKEIKLSEAVRQTEEYAETSLESYKREIERYMLALDRALEGTALAGLYTQSFEAKLEDEDALPQVQHDLRMAENSALAFSTATRALLTAVMMATMMSSLRAMCQTLSVRSARSLLRPQAQGLRLLLQCPRSATEPLAQHQVRSGAAPVGRVGQLQPSPQTY
jgi:hypothetical protein